MCAGTALADIPAGYYDSCEGKTGEALLQALHQKISSHTNVGYDGLWSLYQTSDVYPDGKIWDIYTTKHWTYKSEQCGNVSSSIGGCYNREHSLPKSWWGGNKAEQYSDAFHLYPTDGQVNSQRSNYPYGECANGSSKPNTGNIKARGRFGKSTFSGYSGDVFEPDDMYKGDLARSYFYMVTCYNDRISGWTKGNGNQMFAGNNYPAFKTWAINLFMKWTRQDEVSQKELDRNEAIYAKQHNRNPFIDHPELAEYIWGDKVGQPWHEGASTDEPDILQPVQNVTIDLGYAAINRTRSITVPVKTKAVTGTVYLSTYSIGNVYSVTPTTLTAAQANQGYNVTLSLTSAKAGTIPGTFGVSADDMELEVDITANVVDGLPLYDATGISSDAFTVRWVNIGDATTYTLDVRQGTQSVPGYPKAVTASAESYTVTGLDPLTTYTFQLASTTIVSETKSVTTADLIPSIDVMFDGTLAFESIPGEPSAVAELLLDIENISGDIIINVKSPFEISTDKYTWGTSLTITPEEDRFYMRLNGTAEGSYETSIVITAGNYMTDDAEATGTITDALNIPFIEDWEWDGASKLGKYDAKTFTTDVCKWHTDDGGFWPADDKKYAKSTAIRMGKNSTSTLSMAEDKMGGIGTIAFDVRPYDTDGDTEIAIEYSNDGGTTWTPIETVAFAGTSITSHSVEANKAGNGRIRFRQTSGKRWFIDNIAISNYTELSAIEDLEYHSWDAYCRGGKLVVECHEASTVVSVYGVDGLTWVNNRTFATGEHELELPKGLYIVVSDDFVRRVLVK